MRRWGVVAGAVALVGLTPVVAPDARSAPPRATGLPVVASGARPGPDVLYADAPSEPILQNHDPRFRADPILVMGQEAYVNGEYLYQDWIYDDNGGNTNAQDAGGSDTAGDVDYPAEPERYAGNAADLVELRIAPATNEVAYRFTLNTLTEPDTTVVRLAVGDDVLTAWGTGATWNDAAVGITTDLVANQMTVVVSRSVANPTGALPASIEVGINGGDGEMSGDPYDLGFDFAEHPHGITPHDDAQAKQISSGAPFVHSVDFTALARRRNRTSVPASGTMGRIFPSRIDFGEGKDYDDTPELHGRLQPYSIYVPTTYDASKPAPLMLDLHSLGEHHWQYNESKGVQQIGEERGAIVISCECRGEDGWYLNEAEYDVFEMWNDAARHYNLDPNRVGITGYSMGGYATYRLGGLYPDLFAKAVSIVGPPTAGIWLPPTTIGDDETLTNIWLDNFRNLPIVNAAAGPDELVPVAGTRENLGAPEWGIRGFDQLGYRYRYVLYPTAEHLTIGVLSYDLPYQKEFLGDTLVDRNPRHVTFRYLPASDDPKLGLVHDHAYWISGVRAAKTDGDRPTALVDAFSHASGLGDPVVSEQDQGAGNGPLPYVSFERTWGDAPKIASANTLTLTLTNVSEVTIDLARAGLHLKGLQLDAHADGPVVLHLVDGRATEDRTV